MIRTEDEFQAALEQAAAHLDDPPQPGSARDQAFGALLQEIERYQPTMPAASGPQQTPQQVQADALLQRARAFAAERAEREAKSRLSSFPQDGRGIGPTTGV